MLESWRRHDLLRIEPVAWPGVLCSRPELAEIPVVVRWAASGWPLIVRRRTGEDDPGTIPVGLPLPPGEGKGRLSFQIHPDDVGEWLAARTLRGARDKVPPAWQPPVDAVLGLADRTGVEPRVFGSLLWQQLTGLDYLSPDSDLDLLWPAHSCADAARIVRGLASIAEKSLVRLDGEILLPDGGGVQWREWQNNPSEVLVKTVSGVELRALPDLFPVSAPRYMNASANRIGDLAVSALLAELHVWPKPGLVSRVDSGSHRDMDADTFRASASALRPFFAALARAGGDGVGMAELRTIGQAAERAMMTATGGLNTHRGAIFGLGLLCAAIGTRDDHSGSEERHLGEIVRRRWGDDILDAPPAARSHGAMASRRYGAGGARAEAAAGFPHVYRVGLPALKIGLHLTNGDENAAGVQAFFALMAAVADTNLLHRGGAEGLRFAQCAAVEFLTRGGVGREDWCTRAIAIHREFMARRLSPGGSADLLAATVFVHALESGRSLPVELPGVDCSVSPRAK